jgi:SAM-dependent methyltransferase
MNRASDGADAVSAIAASYDEIPYDSQPFSDARPAYLAGLGALHGLAVAPPSRCRVLELGCASGGHLVPLAWYHPGSEFVGIDLSARQIATGQRLVDALGLGNCELQAGDIARAVVQPESFDYVIAHGLYSWVPESVRKTILPLCRSALRPGGIAYVSYNALPGWRVRGLTRELLEWHVRDEVDARSRLAAAAGLVERLSRVVGGGTPDSYLAMEVQRIRSRPASYLAHEFLEPVNHAVLLHEFIAEANEAGLRYLCNADLSAGIPEMFGELGDAMATLAAGAVELEQYLDFVCNRAFRQSLLCRDDEAATGLRHEAADALFVSADLAPPGKLGLRSDRPDRFRTAAGEACDVSHPLAKAVLARLYATHPRAERYDGLLAVAREEVRAAGGTRFADDEDACYGELFGLSLGQHLEWLSEPPAFVHGGNAAPPRATVLARQQAALGWPNVTTVTHRSLSLDVFGRELLLRLDGGHDREQLVSSMFDWLGRREATDHGARRTDRQHVAANTDRLVALFRHHGILE